MRGQAIMAWLNRVIKNRNSLEGFSDSAASSSIYQSIADAALWQRPIPGLPEFSAEGHLPPGVYSTDLPEFLGRFARGNKRQKLAGGLVRQLDILTRCGCKQVILGGSFVTAKQKPGDFEGLWLVEGTDLEALVRLEPALLAQTADAPTQLDADYGGTLSPWYRDSITCPGLLEYLQYDNRSGHHKGVVLVTL